MLQSEWKELPDYRCPHEYNFFTDEKPPVWAWEMLRRNHQYQADWQQFMQLYQNSDWMTNLDSYHYFPQRHEGEDEQSWMRRSVYQEDATPIKTRIDMHLGKKWNLKGLFDPQLPFSQGVCFLPPNKEYPRLIHTPEEFLELTIEEQTAIDDSVHHVVYNKAVAVVDLCQPLDAQCVELQKLLEAWRQTLLTGSKLVEKKTVIHKTQKNTWLRHIRVLDALRANPPATYQQIGQWLGDKDAGVNHQRKLAEKYISAAKNILKYAHFSMPYYQGSPYQ